MEDPPSSSVLERFAHRPGDSAEVRSEKRSIFIVAGLCSIAGLIWSLIYWLVFGWSVPTPLPLVFTAVVGSALLVSHLTKNHLWAVYSQVAAIIVVPAWIQWSVGGVGRAGFVLAWGVLGPLIALMFFPLRKSLPWVALLLACVILTALFADRSAGVEVAPEITRLFYAMNLGAGSLVLFVFSSVFVTAATTERARANRLLLNVLPEPIAEVLKQQKEGETIADDYDCVSVLFADIVGSTPLFADLSPDEVVDWLNEVFSVLDDVVARHGLEKLRTMGDNYMVAAGVPEAREAHADALVSCAIDMLAAVEAVPERDGRRIALRFGINSGPVVAGVIGKSKFHYDLWGDAVNIAARMESHGEAGRIHISDATRRLLSDRFVCEPRGSIQVKGKGEMQTWFVVAETASGDALSGDGAARDQVAGMVPEAPGTTGA